ncbi:uncharacterized protein LOC143029288 [Oratosquilla oratoria]|uniref:uncharacterized protein LOC143029288 n=1 Tax=Oratosquilla oratoria TaxID=337810 RepID=UPI003F766890
MMEKSKPRVPFLVRFLEFGRTLDQEISKLKDDFSVPPRQRPQNYDRGIKELENETKALKEEMTQVQTQLKEVSTFASFIETTKEMVDQQAEDLKKMETYLQKYGYKPMQVEKQSEEVKKQSEEQDTSTDAAVETEESKPPTPLWKKASPVLSDITRDILMGKGLPVYKSQINPGGTPFEITAKRHQLAENMNKMQEFATPSLADDSSSTGQSSLYEIKDSESSLCITPEVVCQRGPKSRPYLQARTITYTESDTQVQDSTDSTSEVTANMYTGKENSNPFSSQTPEEPILTAARDMGRLRIGRDHENTPEGPVLKYQSDVGKEKNTIEASKTPEEPALVSAVAQSVVKSHIAQMSKNTPEEPVLGYHRSVTQCHVDHESNRTPEEPILSQSGSRVIENVTPEEPVMSSQYVRSVDPTRLAQNQIPDEINGSEKKNVIERPESPELSDVTLNILSLTNSYNNKPSSVPCRDLYNIKTKRLQKEVSQDRSCTEQNENLPVAHENEVQSIGVDCHTEEPLPYSDQCNGDKNRTLGRSKWAGSHISTLSELPQSPQLSDITMSILQGSHKTWKS